MTIREIAALQGMPSWVVNRLLQKGIPEKTLGRALGDAMSLNVLMRIVPRALSAAGLLKDLPKDNWASPKVLGSVELSGLRMPDALLRERS